MSEQAKQTPNANEKTKKQGLLSKLKSIKNIEIIIAVIAVVIMLVIYFSSMLAKNETKTTETISVEDYCQKIERELIESISSMQGAGNTRVIINWESSVESIIAYITNNNSNSSSYSPQIISSNGSSGPIILKEIYPKAIGVLVICQGGEDVKTKLDIINAVSTLLQITPDRINVYKMAGK